MLKAIKLLPFLVAGISVSSVTFLSAREELAPTGNSSVIVAYSHGMPTARCVLCGNASLAAASHSTAPKVITITFIILTVLQSLGNCASPEPTVAKGMQVLGDPAKPLLGKSCMRGGRPLGLPVLWKCAPRAAQSSTPMGEAWTVMKWNSCASQDAS